MKIKFTLQGISDHLRIDGQGTKQEVISALYFATPDELRELRSDISRELRLKIRNQRKAEEVEAGLVSLKEELDEDGLSEGERKAIEEQATWL